MTCDLGQIDAELNGILIQLAHTLHKIKTNLSVEERKNYFNRLSNSNQCVCDWLLELVQNKKGGSAANNSAQNNSQRDSNHNQLLNEFQSRCNVAPSSSTDLPEHTAQLSEERNPSQLATPLSPNVSNADAQSNVISIPPNLRYTSSIRNTADVDLEDTSFANCPAHISYKLSHIFVRCIRNPQSFFSEICRDPIRSTDGMPDVFFDIHDEEENSGIRAELCALYRRFKLRNFYLLAVRLDYHTGERWCRNASSQLADEIKKKHPSRELGDSDLKKYLDEYVRLGQRYNRWAEELGGPGYLLALPLEITEREYTDRHFSRYIPAAIERFRENGIDQVVEIWGLHVLGNHIADKLAQPGCSDESLKRPLTKSAMRSRKKRRKVLDRQASSTEDQSTGLLDFPDLERAINAMPQIDRLTPRLQKELDSIDPWDAEFPPAVASDIDHTSTDTASTGSENAYDIRSQIGPWNAEFPSLGLGNDGIDPLNAEFPHLLAFNTDHTSTDIPSTGSENGYTRSQTDTLGVGFPSLGLGNNAIDPLNAEFPPLLAFDTNPTSTDLPSTSSGIVFDTTSQTHHTSANF